MCRGKRSRSREKNEKGQGKENEEDTTNAAGMSPAEAKEKELLHPCLRATGWCNIKDCEFSVYPRNACLPHLRWRHLMLRTGTKKEMELKSRCPMGEQCKFQHLDGLSPQDRRLKAQQQRDEEAEEADKVKAQKEPNAEGPKEERGGDLEAAPLPPLPSR